MKKEKQILEKINNRKCDLLKGNKALFDPENENLNLIEKVGKYKIFSLKEIIKEKNKAQILEDMNIMGIIIKKNFGRKKGKSRKIFYY